MASRLLKAFLWAQRGLLVWGFFTLAVVAGWCFLNREAIAAYFQQYHQRNALREKVERLEGEVQRLEHERDVLAKGGFGSEKAAREALRLHKPGEEVLYLDFPDAGGESEAAKSAPIE
jgi:cell division protein FtsB